MTVREGGPLRAVLGALEDGATSLDDVAERCDLSRELVDAAIGFLLRFGQVEATPMTSACPGGPCGGCVPDNSHGCRLAGQHRTGPVPVVLTVVRPSA